MIHQRFAVALLVSFASIAGVSRGGEKASKPDAPSPKADLTPLQVVEFQLAALQFNDRPSKDAGIATTFQFASPGNRQVTGPLAHFVEIVKAPGYKPLIDHRIAGYGLYVEQGNLALQRVTVVAADGQVVKYEFRLSKDPESGCWFTDGVVPIQEAPPVDPSKVVLVPHPAAIL